MSNIVLKLYSLVNGVQTQLAELTEHSGDAINRALFGDDGTKYVATRQQLNGHTIIYTYNNEMAKNHKVEISKNISDLKAPFGFTSIEGKIDNTLAIPPKSRRGGDYLSKWQELLPHSSEDIQLEIATTEEKLRESFRKLSQRVAELQPSVPVKFAMYILGSSKREAEETKN